MTERWQARRHHGDRTDNLRYYCLWYLWTFVILTTIRWAKYAKSLPKQEEEGDDIVKKNKVVVLVIVAVIVGLLVGGLGVKFLGGSKGSGNAGNSAASDAGAANGSVYIFGEDKENSYGGTRL